jgi:hypothetical protein
MIDAANIAAALGAAVDDPAVADAFSRIEALTSNRRRKISDSFNVRLARWAR